MQALNLSWSLYAEQPIYCVFHLCSAFSYSYVYNNQRPLPVKEYERYVEDRLLSAWSKQRNKSFFARLSVVVLF